MSKLFSVLVAGLLAGGAMAQSTAPVPPTTKPAGTSATTGIGTTSSSTTGTGSLPGPTTTGTGTPATGSATGTLGAAGAPMACPPGLERRDNSCLPPGQESKPEDQRRSSQTR